MRRLFATLPNGEINPEWDVVNTWQNILCSTMNPACHFDLNQMPVDEMWYAIKAATNMLKAHVEHNPFKEND